jgi:hypothetical protein
MNESVASTPQLTLGLNPNSRPLDTIHVILFPNLSPFKVVSSIQFMKII